MCSVVVVDAPTSSRWATKRGSSRAAAARSSGRSRLLRARLSGRSPVIRDAASDRGSLVGVVVAPREISGRAGRSYHSRTADLVGLVPVAVEGTAEFVSDT